MKHHAAVRAVVRRLIEDQTFDGREELLPTELPNVEQIYY
ncbi:hypothetical protein HDA40_006726 [Hamadaea flava]|nr:hypothetical protein [Hamadaea flava]